MQDSLLPLLRCPVTRTSLTVKVIKRADKIYDGQSLSIIEEAVLYATADWFYPVIGGIPRLNVDAFLDFEFFLKTAEADYSVQKQNLFKKYATLIEDVVKKNKRTKESFTKEWSVYNYDDDKTWEADDELMINRFLKETNETAESLSGKTIFDAGCGHGKLDNLIAPFCGTIIGMDFANCIEEAYAIGIHFRICILYREMYSFPRWSLIILI